MHDFINQCYSSVDECQNEVRGLSPHFSGAKFLLDSSVHYYLGNATTGLVDIRSVGLQNLNDGASTCLELWRIFGDRQRGGCILNCKWLVIY